MSELINVKDIAFHLVNLVILFVAAKFLLYKPVSKFMAQRTERFENERAKIEEGREEIAAFEAKKEALMNEAKAQADNYVADRRAKIDGECQNLIEKAQLEAKKKADDIIDTARAKSNAELEANRRKMVDSSVKMAEFILSRSITDADEDKLVDSFITNSNE